MQGGQVSQYFLSLDTPKLKFFQSSLNKSTITNPRAILEAFKPDLFLKSGISERGQCQLIDRLMDIINLCLQTNCDILSGPLNQPIEHLSVPSPLLDKKDVKQADIVRQFIAQNNMGLYMKELQVVNQAVRANNLHLIQRYASKSTLNDSDADQDFKPSFDAESPGADVLMLLIYTGCKMASQQRTEGAAKIAHICHSISQGFKFKR